MHAGHQGRDVLGATIDALHARGIDVVIYYVMIFADWYWDNHPEARIVDANGDARKVIISSAGRPRRFSTTCPNEPGYREFVVAQIEEICAGYEFEGVWPDMTFWPTVCYCASCRERYRREVGGEIPAVIDWTDPAWVRLPAQAPGVDGRVRAARDGHVPAHQAAPLGGSPVAGLPRRLVRRGLLRARGRHRLAVRRPVRRALRPLVLRQAVLQPLGDQALRAHQHVVLAEHPRARHHPHGGSTCGSRRSPRS